MDFNLFLLILWSIAGVCNIIMILIDQDQEGVYWKIQYFITWGVLITQLIGGVVE